MNIDNILKEARWIGKTAIDFATEDAMKKYLKEHPKANPADHRVVETKEKPKIPEEKVEEAKEKIEEKKKELAPKDIKKEKSKKEIAIEEQIKKRREQLKETGNNYEEVSVKVLESNMENNLKRHEDKSVKVDSITSKDKLSKDNIKEYKGKITTNAKAIIQKYAKAAAPDSRERLSEECDRITSHIEQGIKDGSLKTSADKVDSLVQHAMKTMMHQEIESRRRALGDHGIRHVIANAKNTNNILDELEKSGTKVTGADRLAASIAMINHDVGYTLGQAALSTIGSGVHKQESEKVFGEDQERYNEVFGKDKADEIKHWIGTHDDINFDWKKDPVASSIRFADTMSLFGEDKLPELFLRSGNATKVLTKMKIATQFGEDISPYKEELKKVVDTIKDVDDFQKEELKNSVDEISDDFAVNDFLARYSGRLKGFKFNKETGAMEANIAQSPEHELIQALFEMGQKKYNSLDEDLTKTGGQPEYKGQNRIYKDKDGKPIVQINLVERDKNPINQTTNETLKDFYKHSIRQYVNDAKHSLFVPPERDKKKAKETINSISKKLKEPQQTLLKKVSDEYLAQMDDLNKIAQKPKREWTEEETSKYKKMTNLFNKFPLTDEEKEWLSSKVAKKVSIMKKAEVNIEKEIQEAKRLIPKIKEVFDSVKVEKVNIVTRGYDNNVNHLVARFYTADHWMPVNTAILLVEERTGDIILRFRDKENDIGDMTLVGGKWRTDTRDLKDIEKIFN